MKQILLTGLICVVGSLCYGQKLDDLVIEVDSVTHTLAKPIPFDRPFILKVRTDTKPLFVDYLKNKGSWTWARTIQYRTRKRKTFTFSSIPEENFEIRAIGGVKYLFIAFDRHPYRLDPSGEKNDFLAPSSNYTVFIPRFEESAIEIYEKFYSGDTNSATQLYNKYKDDQNDRYGIEYLVPNLDTVEKYATQVFDKNFKKIDSLRALESAVATDFSNVDRLYQNPLIKLAILNILAADTGNAVLHKTFDLSSQLVKLQTIYNSDTASLRRLVRATVSISTLNKKPGSTVKEKERIQFLKESIDDLKKVLDVIELFILQNVIINMNVEYDNINKLIVQLTHQYEMLTGVQKEYVTVKESVARDGYFYAPETIAGGTIIYDFKSRAKFQIIPDFGYVVYGFQEGFTSFTPYLGFNISFRPMDKNIPFNVYPNRTFLHRLSFTTGWTLSGVEEPGKRENFFSGSSLLTGFGIKFSNALRLNLGTLWFYKNDPNPAIDNRKLTCTFYSGLSVDLDIKELLNDFTSLRPNLQ